MIHVIQMISVYHLQKYSWYLKNESNLYLSSIFTIVVMIIIIINLHIRGLFLLLIYYFYYLIQIITYLVVFVEKEKFIFKVKFKFFNQNLYIKKDNVFVSLIRFTVTSKYIHLFDVYLDQYCCWTSKRILHLNFRWKNLFEKEIEERTKVVAEIEKNKRNVE